VENGAGFSIRDMEDFLEEEMPKLSTDSLECPFPYSKHQPRAASAPGSIANSGCDFPAPPEPIVPESV
jgi:hypothetical protein